MKHILRVLTLLSTFSAAPASAIPLQPTAKWNVDFGDAHCIAMRNYGSADAPLILALKPAPTGDIVQLSVVRPGSNREVGEYGGMMTVDRAAAVPVSMLGFPSGKSRVSAINLSLAAFAPVRSATALRLRSFGEIDQQFALSDMAPVARALDRCIVDLRQQWHIAEAGSQVAMPATSVKPLTSYFASQDYPRVALRAGASGVVELMMLIDETGKVASCMIIGSSGYASLDAQSCSIISTRAKFTPAVGRHGKPLRSGLIQRIRWRTAP